MPMSPEITKFGQVSTPIEEVLDKIQDREDALSRWVVLVGSPSEPLFEHMAKSVLALMKRPRLTLVFAPTGERYLHEMPEVRQWIEGHMVSFTPSILLIRKGEQESAISGAVAQDVLDDAVKQLCAERAGDRMQERIEQLQTEKTLAMLREASGTGYVKIGVTADGQDLYVKAEPGGQVEMPLSRTEAGPSNCSTCDGGGCPDCTDPA